MFLTINLLSIFLYLYNKIKINNNVSIYKVHQANLKPDALLFLHGEADI